MAGVAGARRAEIAALRWTDLEGTVLTIESAVTIANRTSDGRTTPRLVDTRTKAAERHTVTVDSETARIWADLRAEREEYGPYVVQPW